MPSLNLLYHSKTDARFMQDGWKAVWSIPYVSVASFPSLKQFFMAYRSSKVTSRPDCNFEIHQLWQSGFSRVYSNCCCSFSFEAEIIKIGQSSHKTNSNNILNFQESTPIVNACEKKVWKHRIHHEWGMHVIYFPGKYNKHKTSNNSVGLRKISATKQYFFQSKYHWLWIFSLNQQEPSINNR